jgi:hypothetical protein
VVNAVEVAIREVCAEAEVTVVQKAVVGAMVAMVDWVVVVVAGMGVVGKVEVAVAVEKMGVVWEVGMVRADMMVLVD